MSYDNTPSGYLLVEMKLRDSHRTLKSSDESRTPLGSLYFFVLIHDDNKSSWYLIYFDGVDNIEFDIFRMNPVIHSAYFHVDMTIPQQRYQPSKNQSAGFIWYVLSVQFWPTNWHKKDFVYEKVSFLKQLHTQYRGTEHMYGEEYGYTFPRLGVCWLACCTSIQFHFTWFVHHTTNFGLSLRREILF